jgi:hypothetical protein
MTKTHYAAILGALLLAMALLGNADAKDEQRQQDRYCEMVASGAWPAYRGTEGCP